MHVHGDDVDTGKFGFEGERGTRRNCVSGSKICEFDSKMLGSRLVWK